MEIYINEMEGFQKVKIIGFIDEGGNRQKVIEEMMEKGYRGSKVMISHYFNGEKVDMITKSLKKRYPESQIISMPKAGAYSYYENKGGVLLAYGCEKGKMKNNLIK